MKTKGNGALNGVIFECCSNCGTGDIYEDDFSPLYLCKMCDRKYCRWCEADHKMMEAFNERGFMLADEVEEEKTWK